jgi:hypothetical protein
MKAEYISIAPLKKVIDCRKRGEAVYLILITIVLLII